jgi:hypothetical protein
MKYLFDAIEDRMNEFPALMLKGRKLFVGFESANVNAVKPYTELNARLRDRLDTFTSDIEVWDLGFRFHSDDVRTIDAHDWVDEMTAAFKDADIESGVFKTAGCRMTSATVPNLTNGLFDASIGFELTIQREQGLPIPEDGGTAIVPATVDFYVTKDTRIASSSPTGNFDYFYLRVGREGGNFSRSLLHFDVSSIPAAAAVSSASLYLTSRLELAPTEPCKVKRLTTTAWVQTLATWNTSDGVAAWSPPNAASPQTGPYAETDAAAVNLPAGAALGNYIPFTITGLAALVQDAITSRAGQLHVMLLANTESIPATISAEFVDSETSVDLIAGGALNALPPKLTASYA